MTLDEQLDKAQKDLVQHSREVLEASLEIARILKDKAKAAIHEATAPKEPDSKPGA
jgi:hypothetical protein